MPSDAELLVALAITVVVTVVAALTFAFIIYRERRQQVSEELAEKWRRSKLTASPGFQSRHLPSFMPGTPVPLSNGRSRMARPKASV
jgi:Tfp pilus assembly protein FimT